MLLLPGNGLTISGAALYTFLILDQRLHSSADFGTWTAEPGSGYHILYTPHTATPLIISVIASTPCWPEMPPEFSRRQNMGPGENCMCYLGLQDWG